MYKIIIRQKNFYIKNKEYKKAIKIDIDMDKIISKKEIYKVNDETIKKIFNKNINDKNFGFKYN